MLLVSCKREVFLPLFEGFILLDIRVRLFKEGPLVGEVLFNLTSELFSFFFGKPDLVDKL